MNEQVISFETAKLAKEKGFNWNCKYFYHDGRDESIYGTKSCVPNMEYNNHDYPQICTAPTQSELQKWLRDEHQIYVIIDVFSNHDKKVFFISKILLEKFEGDSPNVLPFSTYEEALEDALFDGLELLPDATNKS